MSQPTRITTPFNKGTAASEVVAGLDLTGRRVVVTGASSGIGIETARALASAGAEVTLAVRDIEAGEQAAAAIVGEESLSDAGREAMRNWPWRTVGQGAANSVLAAASPLLEGVGGRYFENCNEALPRDPGAAATDVDNAGVARYAIDPDLAARLWHVSTAMLRDAGWIDCAPSPSRQGRTCAQ
jgi:NAD(P)-dependent dehydrogenase (short-subunit alcohol dehydrogenase family)